MPRTDDPLALEMRKQFVAMGEQYLRFWFDFLVPEGSPERRQLILHEELDEEEEWYLLEETYRKWQLWQAGQIEGDSDIVNFDQNVDGAQERLLELRQTYGDDPEVIDGER